MAKLRREYLDRPRLDRLDFSILSVSKDPLDGSANLELEEETKFICLDEQDLEMLLAFVRGEESEL